MIASLSVAGFASGAQGSTLSYSAATPLSFGAATPCTSPVTGTINVPDSFVITDLNIRFIVSHTWRTDTNLNIVSPAGTDVALLTGVYGANLDNYNVTFDDSASVVVDTGTHVVNQTTTGPGVDVQSEADLLADFIGENAQGDWTYSFCDVYSPADDGTVLDLSLIFSVTPELDAVKTTSEYVSTEYMLPGNDVIYTIAVTNNGIGTVDSGTMVLIDTIPSELTFYNGDMDDGGSATSDPVAFTSTTGSGLTWNYASDVGYSNSATRPAVVADCIYTPAAGYDPNIRHICINPKGEFQSGSPSPNFSVSFRARID